MFIGVSTFGGDGGKSGISQYIINLLDQFRQMDLPHRWEVILYRDELKIFLGQPPSLPYLAKGSSLRPPIVNLLWHQAALPLLAASRGYDVLFLPAGNRRLPIHCPCPTVGTVHDFSSIHVEGKYDPARMFYIKKVLPVLIRRLTKVLTVSQASKKDIVQFTGVPPDRVTVTPLAADSSRFQPGRTALSKKKIAALLGFTEPYLLYISRIEHPGKNHFRLIQAFERLIEISGLPHRLVLAGADRERAQEVHARAKSSPCARSIIFTGFLQNEDIPDLYAGADLFVFPSLYEGFGLPVLEAMASGTAVACSNVSSLPEVAGNAAEMFDPYDPEDICRALHDVLGSPQRTKALRELGLQRAREFNWRRTARQTVQTLEQAAGWTGES